MSNAVVQYTRKGLEEIVSAKNSGLKAQITHVGAGDRSYTPSAEQTQLSNERQRVAIIDTEDLSPTQIRLGAKFEGTLEYEVREVGFYLASGTLLAVYSVPGKLLNYKSPNNAWVQMFTLDISPLPTDSITLVRGEDNINLMLAGELAKMGAAQIAEMHRGVQRDDVLAQLQADMKLHNHKLFLMQKGAL